MDLSINKVNLNKNLNFKGLEGAYNSESVPVLKFYAPPHSSDEKIELEVVFLKADDATGGYKKPTENPPKQTLPFKDDVVEISQELMKKMSTGFAYRYKVETPDGKVEYRLDPFKKIKSTNGKAEYNLIEQGRMYGISPKGGTMRHSFLDSDVKLDGNGARIKSNAEFARNHFNKLGGNIAGLNWLLQNSDELEPYTYFMTTPDIGADKVSSHRYWPANHYQCSNLETFKDFNYNLFAKGKGYVADGAFTSQGIQSPLVQHVLKWGKESPFYDWLKLGGDLTLGVLPDKSVVDGVDAYEHIGVRLVNGKGVDYDKTKPTYIQFYDDRLLSKDRIDSNELEFNYDIAPADHYEITTHQDSVQPYAFEVSPNDKRLKVFNGQKSILLSEIPDQKDFLTFPNFSIGEKNKASGATYWDGNVDIIKMNLSNPRNTQANIQGFNDARNYLFGVADYWTEAIQSHLILETAKKSLGERSEIAKNNGYDSSQFDASSFVSMVLKQGKTVQDYVQEFPLQSLETSEELSAIFAQPQFRKEFFTEERTEQISEMFSNTIDAAIPAEMRGNKEYRTYVTKLYGNDILRNIFVSALEPKAIKKDGKIDTDSLKSVTLKSMERFKSFSPEDERAKVVSRLAKGLKNADTQSIKDRMATELQGITLDDFKQAEAIVLQGKGGLNWRFDAAKDIGDLDAVRNGGKTFDEIWNGDDFKGVQDFWGEFVSRIRKYNPAAYVINEVTSLNDFYKWENETSMRKFDKQLANAYYAMTPEEQSHYENHVPYQKQVQFLDKTNSTTTSEYAKGFNAFSEFAGVNPEKTVYNQDDFANYRKKSGNLSSLKGQMESLMTFNQPNSAIYSHMFTSNHDKPSVLHTLPLNMSVFMAKDMNKVDNQTKKDILRLVGKSGKKFEGISSGLCPKAVGVGLAMQKTIDSLSCSEEDKLKLSDALTKLVIGQKKEGGISSYKRAEAFGVKPYEITIQDLFEYSGIKYTKDDVLDFHKALLSDSMDYYSRLWQVMNACVGTPTLYGGNEFAQTGYETPSKNVYLGIRNEVLHGLKDDPRYSEYYQKMQEASGLYKQPGLSALRNGTPLSLDMINNDASNVSIWPVYKKDSKGSEVVSIITNLGLPNGKASFETPSAKTVKEYQLEKDGIILKDSQGKCPFEEGTILTRFGDDISKYVVKGGAIVDAAGKNINLTDTVTTFYKAL